jgi:hypothetical protein
MVASERKARTKAAAAERKQRAADHRAARAQMRQQTPRTYRTAPGPIAVNARTGRPITYAQARAGMNAAQREVDRILAELEGRAPAAPRPRKQAATKPPSTPLQAAIKEVRAKQDRGQRAGAAKKTGRAQPAAAKPKTPTRKPAKRRTGKPDRLARAIADLIPDQAILAPTTPGWATPRGSLLAKPINPNTRASRQARRGVYGAVLKATCECGGTGRIPVYDQHGDPQGSTSCPLHGRKGRGERKWFVRAAANDAGLPGLEGFLDKKRRNSSKNLDKHQARAHHRATHDPRHIGPTQPCPETAHCTDGIWDKKATDTERETWISAYVAGCVGNGDEPPARRKLSKLAAATFPYQHCSACGGLGVVPASPQVTRDGRRLPVSDWFASAGLREGHRQTGRERSTGRRMTENAARTERRRILPRL